MLWFTADTHFGHERIIDLCDRPFRTANEMNAAIIASFAPVQPGDVLYHLGDVALGGWRETIACVDAIKGAKVLVPGNHDVIHPLDKRHTRPDVTDAFKAVFSSITEPAPTMATAQGNLLLSHFPIAGDSHDEDRFTEWRPVPNEGHIALIHGHVHNAWTVNRDAAIPQINVGWDVWRRPVSLEEILDLI